MANPADTLEQRLQTMPWRTGPDAPIKPTIERVSSARVLPPVPGDAPSRLDAARNALPASPVAAPEKPAGPDFASVVEQARMQQFEDAMRRPSPGERLGRLAPGAMSGGASGIEARRQQMAAEDVARQQLLQGALAGEDARVKAAQEQALNRAKWMKEQLEKQGSDMAKGITELVPEHDQGAVFMALQERMEREGIDDDTWTPVQRRQYIAQTYEQAVSQGQARGRTREAPTIKELPRADGLVDVAEWDEFAQRWRMVREGVKPKPATQITIGDKGGEFFTRTMGEDAGEYFSALRSAFDIATEKGQDLNQLELMVKKIPKGYTGRFADLPIFRGMQSLLAESFNIDPGNMSTIEAAQGQIAKLVLNERAKLKGQGTVSDFEAAMLGKPMPGLADSPEANMLKIALLREVNNRLKRKSLAYRQWRNENPDLAKNPDANFAWETQYDAKQPWSDPEYVSPLAKKLIDAVGGPDQADLAAVEAPEIPRETMVGPPQASSIPTEAIKELRSNPDLATKFDEWFGEGSAARVLNQ